MNMRDTVFIDLEKAYDKVLRQEMWQSIKEKSVLEKYLQIVHWCMLFADNIVFVVHYKS